MAHTARSSMTFINEHDHPERLRPLSPGLEAEIARDERETEFYGADDVREPEELKKPAPAKEAEVDKNLVSWDGPDDPANPQNWSPKYRWFVTLVCCVMTVNV